jgi:Bacterial Ig-like domain (group 3)/Fibronectin type III domain
MRKIFARGIVGVVLALATTCILPMQTAAAAIAGWTLAPGSSVATQAPQGIYCFPGSTECIAVGTIENQTQAFVESNATGTWQTMPSGTPASGTYYASYLYGISCTSLTFCAAVGYAEVTSVGPFAPLVGTFDGSSWSFQQLSVSTTAGFGLTSISCVSASDCLAVGSPESGIVAPSGLLVSFNGAAWSSTFLTNPAPYNSFGLSGISCSDAADCVAVGSYSATGGDQAFAEVLSGGTWSLSIPSTVDETAISLSGVTCTASSCVAVGEGSSAGDEGTESEALIEDYADGSWSVASQGVAGLLSGVSCPAPGVCAAIGSTGPAFEPLVMTYAEGTWAAQPIAELGLATLSTGGVSCASESMCVATGYGLTELGLGGRPVGFLLSGSILGAPDAPVNLAATLGATDQVGLTWTAPTVDGGSPITGYDVFAGAGPGAESTTPVNTSPISGTSYTVTGLAPGTDYFTVEALNAIGASPPSNEVVAASSTTIITSSASPSVTGQSVTFTATVDAVGYGAGTPTGSVVFSVDGTAQPAVALTSDSATLNLATLASGTHTITAAYSGDTNYTASTSSALTQTVLPTTATVTSLTSLVNPTVSGQSTTLNATVKPATGTGTPTGTITFTIDGTAQSPITLASGKAALRISTLTTGTHTVTATYSGDTNYAASTSSALTQTVDQAATTVTLTSSLNPSNTGQTAAFTAVVLAALPGTGTPTGTITFTIDGIAQAPAALGSGKSATIKTGTLTAGTHTVTATYSGDANYAASTSSALTQTVN